MKIILFNILLVFSIYSQVVGPNYLIDSEGSVIRDSLQKSKYLLWNAQLSESSYPLVSNPNGFEVSEKYKLKRPKLSNFRTKNLNNQIIREINGPQTFDYRLTQVHVMDSTVVNTSLTFSSNTISNKIKLANTQYSYPVIVQNLEDIPDNLNTSSTFDFGTGKLDNSINTTLYLVNKGHSELIIQNGFKYNLENRSFSSEKVGEVFLQRVHWQKDFERRITTTNVRGVVPTEADSVYYPGETITRGENNGLEYDTTDNVNYLVLKKGEFVPLYLDIRPRFVGQFFDSLIAEVDDGLNTWNSRLRYQLKADWDIEFFIGNDRRKTDYQVQDTDENGNIVNKFDPNSQNSQDYPGFEVQFPGLREVDPANNFTGANIAPVYLANNKGSRTRLGSFDLIGSYNASIMFIDSITFVKNDLITVLKDGQENQDSVWYHSEKDSSLAMRETPFQNGEWITDPDEDNIKYWQTLDENNNPLWRLEAYWHDILLQSTLSKSKLGDKYTDLLSRHGDTLKIEEKVPYGTFRIKMRSLKNEAAREQLESNPTRFDEYQLGLHQDEINEEETFSYLSDGSFDDIKEQEETIYDIQHVKQPIAFIHYRALLGDTNVTNINFNLFELRGEGESSTITNTFQSFTNEDNKSSLYNNVTTNNFPSFKSYGKLVIDSLRFFNERRLSDYANPKFVSASAYPNPNKNITSGFYVEFELENDSELSIEIISMEGIPVKQVDAEFYSAGKHTKRIFFDKQIPTGSYLVAFKSNTYVESKILVVE
jgi:hypothetical protein